MVVWSFPLSESLQKAKLEKMEQMAKLALLAGKQRHED